MPQASASRRTSAAPTRAATSAQKPIDKFHDGPVHVSIWENQGPKGAFRTASFEIRYKDSQQQWQSGHSYSGSDLLHLEKAASEARARIERWRQEKGTRPSTQP